MIGNGKSVGKFIFIGEHFVALEPEIGAIAFPLLELESSVKIQFSEKSQILFNSTYSKDSFDLEAVKNYIARSTRIACDSLRLSFSQQPLKLESKINFPISRGFGSSGSFAVSLSKALYDLRTQLNQVWELTNPEEEILKSALNVEKIFHGTPSGIDSTTCFYEKGIYFKQSQNKNKIQFLENKCSDIILVDSGERELTETLISNVRKYKDSKPVQWSNFKKRISDAVTTASIALQNSNSHQLLSETINESHAILTELGLSTSTILEIIEFAKSKGALSGKVSGSGGGGAVLLLSKPEQTSKLVQSLIDRNIPVISIYKSKN